MSPVRLVRILPLAIALLSAHGAAAAEVIPPWAGRSPSGEIVRVAIAPSGNSRFHHLAWPKAVRTADGTIVLGYQAGETVAFQLSLWIDGLPVEALPHDGWLELETGEPSHWP